MRRALAQGAPGLETYCWAADRAVHGSRAGRGALLRFAGGTRVPVDRAHAPEVPRRGLFSWSSPCHLTWQIFGPHTPVRRRISAPTWEGTTRGDRPRCPDKRIRTPEQRSPTISVRSQRGQEAHRLRAGRGDRRSDEAALQPPLRALLSAHLRASSYLRLRNRADSRGGRAGGLYRGLSLDRRLPRPVVAAGLDLRNCEEHGQQPYSPFQSPGAADRACGVRAVAIFAFSMDSCTPEERLN